MEDAQAEQAPQLFAQCHACIICTDSLHEDEANELASLIKEHGGQAILHRSPAPFPSPTEISHVVTATVDFPGYQIACDALVPVVKPLWVQTSIIKNKLANPRQHNPDPKLFLNEVVVSCADIPEGDKDAIVGGVLAMGGLYSSRMTALCTHLVALTMDSEKCRQVEAKKLKTKIVLPHWFDDCLRLGKRIDERPYLLPDPEILRLGPNAPVRSSDNKDLVGASTPEPKGLPTPGTTPSRDRRNLNVFERRKVMLSDDLEIGRRLRESIAALITEGGGEITSNLDDTDMFICRYREGDDYKTACRQGKDVGNLSWLYHLITHNDWTSPLRRLLHYPVPRNGIPGFHGLKISLSNYAGEARIYLENLIAAAGGECTKTLKQTNTHLITAHGKSEKCNAAREWSLHVVNHLWLEESYAKCKIQTVSDSRYTHFPHRTNLGEVVGQTKIDTVAIEFGFIKSEKEAKMAGKRPEVSSVMQQKDGNVMAALPPQMKEEEPPRQEATEDGIMTVTPTVEVNNATPNSKRRRSLNGDVKKLQTPAITRFTRFASESKENPTPSTTGSRKSKDIATARLHDIAPDIALYEREKKRTGGVIYGGRRKSDETSARKRSIEPERDADEETTSAAKKAKTNKPPVQMHMIITGYERWVGHQKQEDKDRRRLRELGVLITQDASRCTHLAAPSILRTSKFVNALAYAPEILSIDYLTDCLEQGELLDTDDYQLQDTAAEEKHGFSLVQARENAKANKNKLLKGMTIYCMENMRGGFEAFHSIVESNGGKCHVFRGRNNAVPAQSRRSASVSQDEDETTEEAYLISGESTEHSKLWPRFRQIVREAGMVPKIVRGDWLLDIAMSQEIRWNDKHEIGGD